MVYTTRQAISNYERGLRECPNSIEELILEKLNYSICVKNNTEISKKKDEKMYKFNVFSAPNKEIPKANAANPNVISTLKAGDNIIQKINYF